MRRRAGLGPLDQLALGGGGHSKDKAKPACPSRCSCQLHARTTPRERRGGIGLGRAVCASPHDGAPPPSPPGGRGARRLDGIKFGFVTAVRNMYQVELGSTTPFLPCRPVGFLDWQLPCSPGLLATLGHVAAHPSLKPPVPRNPPPPLKPPRLSSQRRAPRGWGMRRRPLLAAPGLPRLPPSLRA